jgi:hypothetical protein
MLIFIKQYTGRTITLLVNDTDTFFDVTCLAYSKQAGNVSAENYFARTRFIFAGKSLPSGKTLKDFNIQEHATLTQYLRRDTMCYNFNFTTLEVIDPITLENSLNPKILTCGHAFDAETITTMQDNKITSCPICRSMITGKYI